MYCNWVAEFHNDFAQVLQIEIKNLVVRARVAIRSFSFRFKCTRCLHTDHAQVVKSLLKFKGHADLHRARAICTLRVTNSDQVKNNVSGTGVKINNQTSE